VPSTKTPAQAQNPNAVDVLPLDIGSLGSLSSFADGRLSLDLETAGGEMSKRLEDVIGGTDPASKQRVAVSTKDPRPHRHGVEMRRAHQADYPRRAYHGLQRDGIDAFPWPPPKFPQSALGNWAEAVFSQARLRLVVNRTHGDIVLVKKPVAPLRIIEISGQMDEQMAQALADNIGKAVPCEVLRISVGIAIFDDYRSRWSLGIRAQVASKALRLEAVSTEGEGFKVVAPFEKVRGEIVIHRPRPAALQGAFTQAITQAWQMRLAPSDDRDIEEEFIDHRHTSVETLCLSSNSLCETCAGGGGTGEPCTCGLGFDDPGDYPD